MRVAGFPRINLDDYKVVTTEGVESTFKAGRESGPLKLRPPAP